MAPGATQDITPTPNVTAVYADLSASLANAGISSLPTARSLEARIRLLGSPDSVLSAEALDELSSAGMQVCSEGTFLDAIAQKVIIEYESKSGRLNEETEAVSRLIVGDTSRTDRFKLADNLQKLARHYGHKIDYRAARKYLKGASTAENPESKQAHNLPASLFTSPRSSQRTAMVLASYEACSTALKELAIICFPTRQIVRAVYIKTASSEDRSYRNNVLDDSDFENLQISESTELAAAILGTAEKSFYLSREELLRARQRLADLLDGAHALTCELRSKLEIGDLKLFPKSAFHKILELKVPKAPQKSNGAKGKSKTADAGANIKVVKVTADPSIAFKTRYPLSSKYMTTEWETYLKALKAANRLAYFENQDTAFELRGVSVVAVPSAQTKKQLLLGRCNLTVKTLIDSRLADFAKAFGFEIPAIHSQDVETAAKAWLFLSPSLMVTACGYALLLHQCGINEITDAATELEAQFQFVKNPLLSKALDDLQISNPLLGVTPILTLLSCNNILAQTQIDSVKQAISLRSPILDRQIALALAFHQSLKGHDGLKGEPAKALRSLAVALR